MVAPNANAREPDMAATRTDGMNQSLMNRDPSIDHRPCARIAAVGAGHDADRGIEQRDSRRATR